MPKKIKWEDFIQTKEYKMWNRLKEMADSLNISGDNYITTEDIGGVYWEPFFVILFKFGNILKLNGKLKEIKMDWMRPLGYLGSQSDMHVKYDGRDFIIDKGAIGNASNLRFSFQHVLDSIVAFDKLTTENFQANYKEFLKQCKDYFKYLNIFVKDGFRAMHENLKDILGPLRLLRKSGYRLFSLDQQENNNEDLTIFKSKKDMLTFSNNIRLFFKGEEYKMKRDCDIDEFDQYLGITTAQEYYSYKFNNNKRQNEEENISKIEESNKNNNLNENDKDKDKEKKKLTLDEIKAIKEEKERQELLNINIDNLIQREANRFKREALQTKFEEGFDAMFKYLNDKDPIRFPFIIEAHKIFINLTKIPNGRKTPSIEYYLGQLFLLIEDLKIKLYEMKVNGLSRVLIPITNNIDLINHIKMIYDIHSIVDRVIGDFLLYDQYLLMHSSVQFILNSTIREELEVLKRKEFMEDSLPKFFFFQSMRHSVKIMRNMIKEAKKNNKYFVREHHYQITQHALDGENNIAFYAYELSDSVKKLMSESSLEINKILNDEIKSYGRYWLMEGFFPPDDRDIWIEAIEILQTINDLVQEDIRDMLLTLHSKSKDEREDTKNSEDSHAQIIMKKNSFTQKLGQGQKTSTKGLKGNKTNMPKQHNKSFKRQTTMNSEEESIMKLPLQFDKLRPPYVWNFPVLEFENKKKELILNQGKELSKIEIRRVEPEICYKDKRVEKFLILFNKIIEKSLLFCQEEKGNKWNYFIDMVLKVYHISYDKKLNK